MFRHRCINGTRRRRRNILALISWSWWTSGHLAPWFSAPPPGGSNSTDDAGVVVVDRYTVAIVASCRRIATADPFSPRRTQTYDRRPSWTIKVGRRLCRGQSREMFLASLPLILRLYARCASIVRPVQGNSMQHHDHHCNPSIVCLGGR